MKNDKFRDIIAGLYGHTLEWYDFLLYASFAPIFAKVFFPTKNDFVSLLTTFAVFSVAFLMRPVGGVIIGHFADKVGRRKALILTVSAMSCVTFLIGCLPGFSYLGIASPILFIALRLIQSLIVGGELPGSATFLIEHTGKEKKSGLVSSFIFATATFGIAVAALTAAGLSELIPAPHFTDWGWRIAYWLGAALGLIGIYLRLHSRETEDFLTMTTKEKLPIKVILTEHKYALLGSVIYTAILASGNYLVIAYVTTYLIRIENFSTNAAFAINAVSMLAMTLFIVTFGYISQLVNAKRLFLLGVTSVVILIFPIFYLLSRGNVFYALCAELLIALVLSPINATLPTLLTHLFPTEVRASGVSLGYNLGQGLFGGTFPMIGLALVELTANKFSPAWYLFSWGVIVLIMIRCCRFKEYKA